jgi:hypothetical protein
MQPQSAAKTTWQAPEKKGAFGGFIGPRNLVDLVKSAAPWLLDGSHRQFSSLPATTGIRLPDHAGHPLGWWSILLHADLLEACAAPTPAQRTDYFALCLAAHFASVATYVPTDVDAKIRHALWVEQTDRDELERMRDLALGLERWDVSGVSARIVSVDGVGPISGHDGERLSVLCGGLLGFLNVGATAGAKLLEDAIDSELAREARAFDRVARETGRERTLVDLATILTHNAGDVMQSLGSKNAKGLGDSARQRFGDLARERFERYGGAFGRAAAIYREVCASEGHRHYPLREVKILRTSEELLLPLGPFLDDWGAKLARWPAWKSAERAQVVAGLVDGCRRVQGQQGYYRALAGFDRAHPGGLASSELTAHWTGRVKKELAAAEMQKKIAVKRESFEASCAKRVRQVLAS